MKLNKIFYLLLFPLILLSCSKEDEPPTVTGEYKLSIEVVSSDLQTKSVQFKISTEIIQGEDMYGDFYIEYGTSESNMSNSKNTGGYEYFSSFSSGGSEAGNVYTISGLSAGKNYLRVRFISGNSEIVSAPVEVDLSDLSDDVAVDFGLSVLWAKCNLGASNPWEQGVSVVWGDPTGSFFEECDLSLCGGKNPPGEISGTDLDIGHVNIGDGWRLPTLDEVKELANATTKSNGSLREVSGCYIRSGDHELFFPYSGYWTGTLNEATNEAYYFYFNEKNTYTTDEKRNYERKIRLVRDRNYKPKGTAKPMGSFTKPEPTSGYINGYEWVDLGLPSGLKWATCNVGASSPSDYGNYYAWGETTTKTEYTSSNCKTYGESIGDISGNSSYDAARANWGSSWRMPTKSEFKELLNNCTWTWTSQGGHNGYKVKSKKNGNSIFLPAAGYRHGSSLDLAGGYGCYWSSTPDSSNTQIAYYLFFDSGYRYTHWDLRYFGQSVRAVSE